MTASRHALVTVAALLAAAPAVQAQSTPIGRAATASDSRFEVGAIGGIACTGSEGSACGGDSGLGVLGGYGSFWLTPRLELQARLTRFDRSTNSYRSTVLGSDPRLTITVTHAERSRALGTGLLLYHFGRQPLQAFAGLGYGVRRDRQHNLCVPAACAALPAGLRGGNPLGRVTTSGRTLVLSAGVYGRFHSRWVARGGVTLHNWPGGESLSAAEVTAALGVRF